MRKLILLAGVAAFAASMPALAKEQDRGRGGGRGHAAHAQNKGGGQGRAERGHARHQQARGGERRAERRGRGNDQAERRLNRRERRVERAIQQERSQVRQVREARREDRRVDRRVVREVRRDDRRDWRGWAERRLASRDRFDDRRFGRRVAVGREGCPPGLARQNRFCMPPGQLRKAHVVGRRLPISSLRYNVPERYRYRFVDNDRWFYRYDDAGFVYRFDRRNMFVNRVVPLFGSGLMIGEPMPLGYEVYNVPLAYRSFYQDRPDYYYRYDDSAIYRVNRESSLVEGIVALLTGGSGLGGLGVGDRLPGGYSAYNVPFAYRDTYYDSGDAMYRYADNSIYRVDPQTQLIEAVISLLT